MSTWFTYIVRCGDDSLYTGITTDLVARVARHNAGKGAAYTRSRLPVALVWSELAASESAARKREAQIKRWSRAEKIALCRSAKGVASRAEKLALISTPRSNPS